MLKQLAIKELRESAGLIALAALCAVGIVGPLMGMAVVPWGGSQVFWYPFINNLHIESQALAFGAFVLVLGLKQTAYESHQGTFRFLLHRPLSRNAVFVVKLLVGATAVAAVNAFMIGLYGWWSASAGNHPSPYFWSMTAPSCKLGGSLVLVYLGGFLSGVRPAKWVGTRLVPAAFSIACAFFVYATPWWWCSIAIGLASAVALLIAIFYYVQTSEQ